MLGVQRGKVELIEYNNDWRNNFDIEAGKIKKIFGDDLLRIEHVGSTAIPGILAKPIIDIALLVSDLQEVKKYVKGLKKIGYNIKVDDEKFEGRLFFTKGTEEKRTNYLHVGDRNSNYIVDMITFKELLLENEDLIYSYSEIKRFLADKYQDDRKSYTESKTDFVKRVLNKRI